MSCIDYKQLYAILYNVVICELCFSSRPTGPGEEGLGMRIMRL